MATTTSLTLDAVLELANRLPRQEQAELIARLARTLAVASPRAQRSPEEVQTAWDLLRAELRARPPGHISMAEQLEADRRDRDHMTRGYAASKN